MHELYIALTSFVGDSCMNEHMSSVMHSCMVLTLFLLWNGSVERTSSITCELYIALISFVGEFCRGEHNSSVILSLCLVLTFSSIKQLR